MTIRLVSHARQNSLRIVNVFRLEEARRCKPSSLAVEQEFELAIWLVIVKQRRSVMTLERPSNFSPLDNYASAAEPRPLFRASSGIFPQSALNSPMFEGKDIAGIIAAAVITLGPLAAYSLGWGA